MCVYILTCVFFCFFRRYFTCILLVYSIIFSSHTSVKYIYVCTYKMYYAFYFILPRQTYHVVSHNLYNRLLSITKYVSHFIDSVTRNFWRNRMIERNLHYSGYQSMLNLNHCFREILLEDQKNVNIQVPRTWWLI